MMNLAELGRLVVMERKRKGLSQATLAHLANVTPSTLSYLETAKKESEPDTVRKVLAALELDLHLNPVTAEWEPRPRPAPPPESGAQPGVGEEIVGALGRVLGPYLERQGQLMELLLQGQAEQSAKLDEQMRLLRDAIDRGALPGPSSSPGDGQDGEGPARWVG